MNRSKFRLRIILAAGLTSVVVSAGVVSGYAGAASPQPTFGPIPAEAMAPGRVDLAKIPDYVSVLGKDGEIAGYVSKADLFPDPRQAPKSPEEAVGRSGVAQPIPVYDAGRRVIGHWAGREGFVAG